MFVTTSPSPVWKRMADENQQSVKLLTRICIGLFVLSLAAGAYAYALKMHHASACVPAGSPAPAAAAPAQAAGDDYCV